MQLECDAAVIMHLRIFLANDGLNIVERNATLDFEQDFWSLDSGQSRIGSTRPLFRR